MQCPNLIFYESLSAAFAYINSNFSLNLCSQLCINFCIYLIYFVGHSSQTAFSVKRRYSWKKLVVNFTDISTDNCDLLITDTEHTYCNPYFITNKIPSDDARISKTSKNILLKNIFTLNTVENSAGS